MLYQMIFSPTGGTRKAAALVAQGLGQPCTVVDLTCAPAPADLCLTAEDVCLLAVPSFGGRVPVPAVQRLGALRGNGARAVLLCVYGNREYEDTLAELQDAAEAAGFRIAAAVTAIAEHSVVRDIAAGRPDESDAKQLQQFGAQIAQRLAQPSLPPLELPGNRPYKAFKGGGMVPRARENCIACGLCAARCPVGAISPAVPRDTDESRCISCMACVAACPRQARGLAPEMQQAVSEMLHKVCAGHKENQLF